MKPTGGLKPRGLARRGMVRKPSKLRSNRRIRAHRGKEKSISKLVKEADKLHSDKTRQKGVKKDGLQRCYTCGLLRPWKKLHCGHYLSRFYKAARWEDDNTRPQCMMCNLWKKGDLVVYRANLIKEIGIERVEAVEAKRHQSTRLTKDYLKELIISLSSTK